MINTVNYLMVWRGVITQSKKKIIKLVYKVFDELLLNKLNY